MGRRKRGDDEDEALNLEFARKHLFREPRKRHDVVHRKAINAQTSCSVVKATLNQFTRPAAVAIRTPLNVIVAEVNRTIAEAYILANVHVNRMLQNELPLGPLDQSFFYGCLSAVSQAGRAKTEIKDRHFGDSVNLYLSWTRDCPGHTPPDSQFLASGFHQQASLQMATNTRVALSENFSRRFKRYLKHKYQLDGSTAWSTLRSILAAEYEGEDPIVLAYRAQLPKRPGYGRMEDTPHLVLPLTRKFLQHFETQHREEGGCGEKALRLFSLLPNKTGFECTHVKLCNNGLYGLLKRSGFEAELPSKGSEWRAAAPEFWKRIFNIEKYETSNRKFAGEVLTDGHSVSIVMRKPKKDAMTQRSFMDLDHFKDIIGVDPGRRDLLTTCDLEGRHTHYTTKRYREDAGHKASLKTIQGWMDRCELARTVNEGIPTRKTSDLDVLKRHVLFVLPVLSRMLQWHMDKPFRKLKLRRYISSKRALRKMCAELTAKAGRQTLVGFGDWSNRDSAGIIKKSPSGPVKKLEAELRRHCKVVSVDEFRTSKLHSHCGCQTRNAYCHKHERRSGELKGTVKAHSVLHCAHNGCSGISMNRDDNASLNILRLLILDCQGFSRPPQFCRGFELRDGMPAPFGEVGVWPVSVGFEAL